MRSFLEGLGVSAAIAGVLAFVVGCCLFYPWLFNTMEGILRTQYGFNIPDFAFWHWVGLCWCYAFIRPGTRVTVKRDD